MTREIIENIILGMADIVEENRFLRQKLRDLDLENRKNKAYAIGNYEEGEKLSNMFMHNLTIKVAKNSGWLMSDDELRY